MDLNQLASRCLNQATVRAFDKIPVCPQCHQQQGLCSCAKLDLSSNWRLQWKMHFGREAAHVTYLCPLHNPAKLCCFGLWPSCLFVSPCGNIATSASQLDIWSQMWCMATCLELSLSVCDWIQSRSWNESPTVIPVLCQMTLILLAVLHFS